MPPLNESVIRISLNMGIQSKNIQELSDKVPFKKGETPIHYRSYGGYLEDFKEGFVFEHPRGITFTHGLMYDFASTYFEANPIYLNSSYASHLGHKEIPASPLLVMNAVLSLGVQDNSEKAYANLGYYDMHFLRSVYAGDTITSFTKIAEKRERGDGKPGIITLHTVGFNQNQERVIQYRRKIMVNPRPQAMQPKKFQPGSIDIPDYEDTVDLNIPAYEPEKIPRNLTGHDTYYKNFKAGDVIVTHNGRTLSDEHFAWTYKVGNTHPLHFDRVFTQSLSGAMSGEPIIYGGLVFAWLLGLASRDISENAVWDMGYTEGYHTQPVKSGDTIHVIHRVLGETQADPKLKAGIKQFQVIGLKNIAPEKALDQYAEDLFIKENNKKKLGKEKIPEKIFEIERKLLILDF